MKMILIQISILHHYLDGDIRREWREWKSKRENKKKLKEKKLSKFDMGFCILCKFIEYYMRYSFV